MLAAARQASPSLDEARVSARTAVTLALAALLAATAVAAQTRTLERVHDPVVVRTGLLGDVTDRATARYRLYAAHDGRLQPIPYQFDQRDAAGAVVFAPDGEADDFTFDADDELVFMAKDTGDRVATVAEPGADDAREIEVRDPTRDARGWAYLVHFSAAPPPRSPVRYARFDPARDEAHAAYYDVSYAPGRSNYLSGIRIAPAAGGTGAPLVGRMAMRIDPTFSILGFPLRERFTEESFAVVPDGVRNGPVRSIRRVRQSLDLGRWFPDIPSGDVYTYYYFSSFTTPSTFEIPWLALQALRDFRFESVSRLAPAASDSRYWDGRNRAGVPFAPGRRPVASDDDHRWFVMSARDGAFLQALTIPRAWLDWGIRRGVVFHDGAPQPDGASDAGAGFSLRDMTKLARPGAYALGSTLVVLPTSYRPGDEEPALAMLDAPLAVDVRSVARATAAATPAR